MDEPLVVAAVLLVGDPDRLLGVVRLQRVLLLHLERDDQEGRRICNSGRGSNPYMTSTIIFWSLNLSDPNDVPYS